MFDITGDIVLEERQTRYDGDKDDVILSVRIDRLHSDYGAGLETLGGLDANLDGGPPAPPNALLLTAADLKGRPQITATWYDNIGRVSDRVEYGNYGGASFNRDGLSVPSRSDTALRTSYAYSDDGTVETIEDARGLVTKFEYDAQGRKRKEIKNFNAAVNSGNPSGTDDNITVRYEYTAGLRTRLISDLVGGGTQETIYTYGTTKGVSTGDSKIETGHLLQKVTYPDSSGSSDALTFAYDAQGAKLWKQDQAGNVYEQDRDSLGRVTARRVTTLAPGFDGAVRRIEIAYDGLGRTTTVTQYDAASSGSVVDEVKYTYDGWGNVESFRQDRDSAVDAMGSVNDYSVSYTYGKQTTGRNTVRRTSMTLPSGNVITYGYLSRNGLYDNAVSRVTEIQDGVVTLALYDYNGVGQVVGTDYTEADAYLKLYDPSSPGTFPDLDRFNRVVTSRWTKDLTPPIDFYHVELTYDRDSNITSADDQVHTGFDVKYTMDGVNRLTRAEEGTLGGGSISSRTRDEQWTLSHTGNWDRNKVDLNGDGDFVDADEVDDTRTHDGANELTARDTDSNGSSNFSLSYDPAGDVTDDNKDYKYEYDAFYRLRKVKQTANSALVAEYRYNGLGYKIAAHEDTDADGDVDVNDKWFYEAFDERWRQVAIFRENDSDPKAEYVHHASGADGRSPASYVDAIVCRYRDADSGWASAADGVLEERLYYCQNAHADVVAICGSDGTLCEGSRYSAYGVPFGLPGGDANSDGDCDASDGADVQAWITAVHYDVRGDADLDGDVDASDQALLANWNGTASGRGVLSSTTTANQRGFSGRMYMIAASALLDHRRRALHPGLGRWLGRDPIEYRDGMNQYQHVRSNPVRYQDPSGAASTGTSSSVTSLYVTEDCGTCKTTTDLAHATLTASGDPAAPHLSDDCALTLLQPISSSVGPDPDCGRGAWVVWTFFPSPPPPPVPTGEPGSTTHPGPSTGGHPGGRTPPSTGNPFPPPTNGGDGVPLDPGGDPLPHEPLGPPANPFSVSLGWRCPGPQSKCTMNAVIVITAATPGCFPLTITDGNDATAPGDEPTVQHQDEFGSTIVHAERSCGVSARSDYSVRSAKGGLYQLSLPLSCTKCSPR